MILADYTRTHLLREWERIGIRETDGKFTVTALVNNRVYPVVLFKSLNRDDCEELVMQIASAIEEGRHLFPVPRSEC